MASRHQSAGDSARDAELLNDIYKFDSANSNVQHVDPLILEDLKAKNRYLEEKLKEMTEKYQKLEKQNDKLKENMSSLLLTSRAEIARKSNAVISLREELSDLKNKQRRRPIENSNGNNESKRKIDGKDSDEAPAKVSKTDDEKPRQNTERDRANSREKEYRRRNSRDRSRGRDRRSSRDRIRERRPSRERERRKSREADRDRARGNYNRNDARRNSRERERSRNNMRKDRSPRPRSYSKSGKNTYRANAIRSTPDEMEPFDINQFVTVDEEVDEASE